MTYKEKARAHEASMQHGSSWLHGMAAAKLSKKENISGGAAEKRK